MIRVFKKVAGASALAAATLVGSLTGALADPATENLPRDWQLWHQPAVTEVMRSVEDLHSLLMIIITGITLLVTALIIYVAIRFNRKSNPVPSKTTHNTFVEIVWTLIPVLILVVVAIPSFKLLYLQDRIPPADMTVKAIGNQWYWSYEYPDHDDLNFDANMLTKDEAEAKRMPYLFATDTHMVVPVNKTIRVQVTASDVIHAWTIPAFGIKIDAVPGRLNETWFRAEKEGLFYGQCSELCGQNHAFMPIVVEVVSEAKFAAWLERAQAGDFASNLTTDGAKIAAAVAR